ncbi:MAG: zinc ribbon domain-containing protein [Clostridia bacterium]|nr:zinc ribbon domain-containing protein [Clostridia bacterium]
MVCPKCGAQVDDKEIVCPYCKEELKTPEQEIKPEEQAPEAEAAAEQTVEQTVEPAAEPAAEKNAKPKKEKKPKLELKNPKTAITVIAAVVAAVIFILAIFGIVSMAKKIVGPENMSEEYVEAMAEGNIRKALRKTAPWVLRNMAEMLDLDENASASKIAREYEEQMGEFGLGSKIEIEEVSLRGYTDSAIGEALNELDIFDMYTITYKELKAITEIAMIEVEAYIKVMGEKEYVTFDVYCARLDGDWVVIQFESSY